MISPKDWKAYNAMLDIEDELGHARVQRENERLRKEWQKQCDEDIKRMREMGGWLPHFPWSPCPFVLYTPSRKRTVEACLDWIVQGRPVFAKKIKAS